MSKKFHMVQTETAATTGKSVSRPQVHTWLTFQRLLSKQTKKEASKVTIHAQVILSVLPSCAMSSEYIRVGYQTYQILTRNC